MITLTKLAGYEPEENLEDKVAEAMDFMAENGIDPIGGLTLLANTDENLTIVDEKVAAIAQAELTEEQSEVLAKVAEYLGGVDENVASVALNISANAEELADKVAAFAAASEEAGMPFEDAMILAASVYEDGSVDDKVANEAIALGYTDEHLEFSEKIAQELAAETGLEPEEALTIYKEAASIKGAVDSVVQGAKKMYNADIKNTAKKAWGNYKAAITGKGADKVKARLEKAKSISAKAAQKSNEERQKGEEVYNNLVSMANSKNKKEASRLGSKAQYRYEQKAKKHSAASERLNRTAERAQKSLNQIRKRQALAIGGTAAGTGALGYAGYKATQN